MQVRKLLSAHGITLRSGPEVVVADLGTAAAAAAFHHEQQRQQQQGWCADLVLHFCRVWSVKKIFQLLFGFGVHSVQRQQAQQQQLQQQSGCDGAQ